MGELWLAVSPQVLVAETAGDLEILLEASHHQQLLELLRRLGQSVEAAGVDPAGHQVVPCPFGSALDQNRGLDLDEAALIQEITDKLDHPVAENDVSLHTLAAQVEIPIFETQGLVNFLFFVDVERWRLGRVEYPRLGGQHLDLAGGHVWIFQTLRPETDRTPELKHILRADFDGHSMGLGRGFRVKDNLGDPLPVPQIKEDQAPVITPSVHPTSQSYLLSLVFGPQFATGVSLEHRPASPSSFTILYYWRAKKTNRLHARSGGPYPSPKKSKIKPATSSTNLSSPYFAAESIVPPLVFVWCQAHAA